MISSQASEKYKATILWNDVIRAFRNQMELKPHWKHFKTYPDTFTGAEAVNWLHGYLSARARGPEKVNSAEPANSRLPILHRVTREQALALLNKFYDHGLFERVRRKSQEKCSGRVKDDNNLYRFADSEMTKFSGTPLALKSHSCLDGGSVSGTITNRTPSKKSMFNTRPVLPVTPISYRKLIVAGIKDPQCRREENGNSKPNDETSQLIDRLISLDQVTDLPTTDEKLEMSAPTTACSSRQSSIRIKNGQSSTGQGSGASIGQRNNLPQIHLVARNLTGDDVENVWKTVAMSVLRQLLQLDDNIFDDLLHISGENICHNAKCTTPGGVTRVFSKQDDLPDWTLQAMKCLANWPWKNNELNWPCYPGFERDVFATVLDFFATQTEPLVPLELQELMLELVDRVQYLDVQRWDASHEDLMKTPPLRRRGTVGLPPGKSSETEFGAQSPITRLVNLEPRTRASVASLAGKRQDDGLAGLRSELEANVRSLEEIMLSLPGLVKSPRVLHQLKELKAKSLEEGPAAKEGNDLRQNLTTPHSAIGTNSNEQFGVRIPPSFFNLPGARFSLASTAGDSFSQPGSPPLVSSIYEASLCFFTVAGREMACKVLQICLLFLPPRNRRWLQLVLRMMSKICVNYCLRLDKHNSASNRSIVLEQFCDVIIPGNHCDLESSNRKQRMTLISFLLDSLSEVFSTPIELIAAVENRLRQIQRAKICYSSNLPDSNGLDVNIDNVDFAYCQRISPHEYEQQATYSSRDALQKLLVSIAEDQTISGTEKRKRLKKFKNSYPDLFYQRFPNKTSFETLIKTSGSIRKSKNESRSNIFTHLQMFQ